MQQVHAAWFLSLLAVSGHAVADPSATDKALASQLYEEGKRLVEAQQLPEACPKFAESQRIDPQLGTLMHLADCYDKAGKTASAWTSFREAAAIAAQRSDKRAQTAKQRQDDLEARLSILQIDVVADAPDSVEVTQDGTSVGRAAWGVGIPTDPGVHTISARAAGFQDWSMSIEVQGGPSVTRVLIPKLLVEQQPAPPGAESSSLPPEPTAPVAPAPAPQSASPSTAPMSSPTNHNGVEVNKGKPTSGWRTTGYAVAGTGVAALSAGIVFALVARSKIADRDAANSCSSTELGCSPAQADEVHRLTSVARTDATIATATLITGGTLMAAGLALIVANPSSRESAGAWLEARPWAGPRECGFGIGGTW